ncbi:FG-GAP-like repeat-containing protein, partial [Gynuella sp.]|uniref:FG-GAP-like repeat-containing protein n=1 Tax=Gynuella sp. TaxID=2969146 RepID=UPI003D101689
MKHLVVSLAFALIAGFSTSAIASTNLQTDSFNIYKFDTNKDGKDDLVFIAKPRYVLIASGVLIPIKTYDSKNFTLLNDGKGGYTYSAAVPGVSGKNPVALTLWDGDFNGDGLNDVAIVSSGGASLLNGSNGNTPSVSNNASIGGIHISTNHTYQEYSGEGGSGFKITHKSTGASWIVDAQGNPLNPTRDYAPTTLVGNLKGDFTVSEGGSATYYLPLDLPAGPGGIKPNISLNYDSQNGNGQLGKGWAIGGLETIARCPQKKPNSSRGTLQYNNTDRFCLNGQRLVAVSGNYGANGTSYRTEIDSQVLVVSRNTISGGPLYFDAYLENGVHKQFGNSASSRLSRNQGVGVKAWALSSVNLPGTNAYTLNYLTNSQTGEQLISSINYGQYSVQFHFEERPDRSFGWSSGSKYLYTKRLRDIQLTHKNNVAQNYTLFYGYSRNHQQSMLQGVQLCSYGKCLEPLKFSWHDDQGELLSRSGVYTDTQDSQHFNYRFIADMDGDGRADFVADRDSGNDKSKIVMQRGQSDGKFGAPSYPVRRGRSSYVQSSVVDINGDGSNDYCQHKEDRLYCNLFGTSLNRDVARERVIDKIMKNGSILYADIDGDGYTEAVHWRDGSENIRVYSFNLHGREDSAVVHSVTEQKQVQKEIVKKVYAGDFDGNGRMDLLIRTDKSAYIRYGKSDRTLSDHKYNFLDEGETISTKWVADMNGDGMDDIVYTKSLNGKLYVRLSNGLEDGFSSPILWSSESCVKNETLDSFADVNGDGRADAICLRSSSGSDSTNTKLGRYDDLTYRVQFTDASGTGFYKETSSNGNIIDDITGTEVHGFPLASTVADIDGDGDSDLVIYETSQQDNRAWTYKSDNEYLAITGITDSNGNTSAISYASMTDGSVYYNPPATQAVADRNEKEVMSSRTYLVKQVSHSSNSNQKLNTYYKYGGAYSHNVEGYLGFSTIVSTSDRASWNVATGKYDTYGIVATTYKRQSAPFIGKTVQVVKRTYAKQTAQSLISKITLSNEHGFVFAYSTAGGSKERLFEHTEAGLQPIIDLRDGTELKTYDSRTRSIDSPSGGADSEGPKTLTNVWASIALNGGVKKTYLQKSAVTYFDYQNLTLKRNRQIQTNTYTKVSGCFARLTKTEQTSGLGDYQVKATSENLSFRSNSGCGGYANFQPTRTRVTRSAIGSAWQSGLASAATATSEVKVSQYSYTSDGQLQTVTAANNSSLDTRVSYTYDSSGNMASTVISPVNNATGRTTKSVYYNGTAWLSDTYDAVGHRTQMSNYTAFGQPQTIRTQVDARNWLTTTVSYDELGREISRHLPSGVTINTHYGFCRDGGSTVGCTNNNLYYSYQKITTSGQPTVYNYYDKLGQLTKTATQSFNSSQYILVMNQYDQFGRQIRVSTPVLASLSANPTVAWNDSRFDLYDRQVQVNRADGGITKYSYQANGQGYIRTITNRVNGTANRVTVETYNHNDQLLQVKAPNGAITTYVYDVNGKLVSQKYSKADHRNIAADPEKIGSGLFEIRKTYDLYGNLTSETDPDKGKTQYSYDAYGQVTKVVTAKNQTTQYSYDDLGRTTRQYAPEGTVCWYYDEGDYSYGQLSEVRQWSGNKGCGSGSSKPAGFQYSKGISYNAKGLSWVVEETLPGLSGTYATTYDYDSYGRLLKIFYPGSDLDVGYRYSGSGYLSQTYNLNTKAVYETVSAMDAWNNVTGQKLGSALTVNKSYQFSNGRLNTIVAKRGSTTLLNQKYSFDYSGNLTALQDYQAAPVNPANWMA